MDAFAVMIGHGHDLIRIPDVYEVEINLTSLFPENVNNYLYRYTRNATMIYHGNKALLSKSQIGEPYYEGALDNVVNALAGAKGMDDTLKPGYTPPSEMSPEHALFESSDS